MSLTLKQYLEQYHATKSTKNSSKCTTENVSRQFDYEQIFNQKILSLKKSIKKHIQKHDIYIEIEKQLDSLKSIFHKIKNMSFLHHSKNEETMCFSKKSIRGFKKDNLSIPILTINDDGLDELRTTLFTARKQRDRIQTQQIQIHHAQIDDYLQNSSTKQNNINQLNKSQKNEIQTKKIYKGYSKQYATKIIPVFPSTTPNSQVKPNKTMGNMLPPKLDKIYSDYDDQLRNTLRSSDRNGSQSQFRMTIK